MKTWKGYQKGVNLGGWFSQCDYSEDRFNNFITEDDFKELTSWGLDHLRLPVDYNLVETEDGQYKEEGFARIKRALELGHKYGFNMILDLHKTAGYSFDPGEKQSGFFGNEDKLWKRNIQNNKVIIKGILKSENNTSQHRISGITIAGEIRLENNSNSLIFDSHLNLYNNSIHQLYNALNHDNNTLHHQSTHLKTFSCTLYRASHPPLQQHAWFHNPAPVFWHRFPGLHLLFLSGQLYFRPMACQSLNQIP